MGRSCHRRSFLQQVALTTSAAWLATTTQGRAIEPIERNGSAKFKFSLAAYSYRSLLQGADSELDLADFISDCAAMQLEGTELTSYYFPEEFDDAYLYGLRQQCFRLGLDISGTAIRNDFALPPGEERAADIAHTKRWIEHAAKLGAPVIRVFAGKVPADSSPAEAHRRIVDGMQECCDYAGRHGVHLALENHGGPTSTADGLLAIVRDVDSPWFGVNMDTGNFHSDDVYGELEQIAPYSLNVQVKVVISGPDKAKRPSDFHRIAQILRDHDYRGYVVLEYEESEDPRKACPTYLRELREAFAPS